MKLFFPEDKMPILENIKPVTPITQLDEIDAISNSIDANMEKEISIPKDVMNSFSIKDSLNPDIWTGGKLEPRVRLKLLKIAKDFLKDLDLPKKIIVRDVYFTGSLANFNWSKFSDIDLHIVLDYNQFETSPEFVENYFHAQKSIWNQEHDITVFDYPVELYVQDKNHKMSATAIFSVLRNRWILKPTHQKFQIDKDIIKRKANDIIYNLKDIKQDYKDKRYQSVIDKVTKLKHKIKLMRLAGLEKGGEFSKENLVFKVLRRTPFMDVLDSFRAKSYDTLMSVSESLNEDITENAGSVLLIKGTKLEDGTHRLYMTTIRKIMNLDRTKVSGDKGIPASMVVISNDIKRIDREHGKLMVKDVYWKSDASKLQALGLSNFNVVLNDEKTPLWRDTIKYKNPTQVVNTISSINTLPDIRWVG
jgi:hypothetical protein